jgi:predicted DNA-binding antitoxin AbrB/MazE fold protein
MAGTVRARMRGGMLELLEKVDLPEGKEVSVTILETPTGRDFAAFDRAAGSWKGTIDVEAFLKNNAESRMRATRPVPYL